MTFSQEILFKRAELIHGEFTSDIDRKIDYCYGQARGWETIAHDYDKANRWLIVAKWFESKKDNRIKSIFGH